MARIHFCRCCRILLHRQQRWDQVGLDEDWGLGVTLAPPQVLHRRLLLAPPLHPMHHPDGRHGSPHVVHQLLPAGPVGHWDEVETGGAGDPRRALPLT